MTKKQAKRFLIWSICIIFAAIPIGSYYDVLWFYPGAPYMELVMTNLLELGLFVFGVWVGARLWGGEEDE